MDQIPLVKEEIDAGKAFIREFTKYAPVSVALWVKESGDELHYLYIASDQIHDTNVRQGYGEVMRIARSRPLIWIPFGSTSSARTRRSRPPLARSTSVSPRGMPLDSAAAS
jgi:hypothetical protein